MWTTKRLSKVAFLFLTMTKVKTEKRKHTKRFFSLSALWSKTAKNTDCSTGPLARPFARSLAPLTRSLAPDCSLRSRPPLRSLARLLAHFAHSCADGKVNDWMAIYSVFFSILVHNASSSSSLPPSSVRPGPAWRGIQTVNLICR